MRVGWGKPYNALYRGTVTRINCKDGDAIKRGSVIAHLMRADGASGPVNAPFDGVIRLYIEQGSQFDQSELLFHIEYADADHSETEPLADYLHDAEAILLRPDLTSMAFGLEPTPYPLRQMLGGQDVNRVNDGLSALVSLLHSGNGNYRRIAALAFGQLGFDSAPILEMLERRKADDPAPDVLFALGIAIATLRLRPRQTGAKEIDRRRKLEELSAMYG